MRSVSASLKRMGLIFLSAAVLGAGVSAPGVAKSAPAAATASSGDTRQAEEAPPAEAPAGEAAPVGEQASSAESAAVETTAGGEASGASGDSGQKWLTDEESGRRYSIEKIPKVKGTYLWRDENHIRLPGGLFKVEVVKHDDKWFWVKLWEPPVLPNRYRPAPLPTPEELDRMAATYRPEAGTHDRIRLEPFDEGLPRSGQWRQGFDVADMNGDEHLDIVYGPSRKGRPVPNIFLGDSRGHWRRWNEARFPKLDYDYGDAEAADFNGDGHQDVAFGFHLRGMLALIGDGKGGFEPWTEGLELEAPGKGGDATSFSSRAIEAIDWNHDGRPDLLALGEGPKGVKLVPGKEPGTMINTARSFVLFLNDGDGSWSWEAIVEGSGDFGNDFAIGDFDRDGRLDLVLASRRRGNRRLLRTSSAGKDGLLAAAPIEQLRSRAAWTSVAAADLDGDGFEEILVGYISRELDVWRTGIDLFTFDPEAGETSSGETSSGETKAGETGDPAPKAGWQRRIVASQESRAGVWDMTVGELDGDGAPDLVALTGQGEVWVLLGDRRGSFAGEESPELPRRVKGCEGSEVRLVDLDGDGRDEVLASFSGEPSGPKGFPGVISFPGCPGQGRIYAWRVVLSGEQAVAGEKGAGDSAQTPEKAAADSSSGAAGR